MEEVSNQFGQTTKFVLLDLFLVKICIQFYYYQAQTILLLLMNILFFASESWLINSQKFISNDFINNILFLTIQNFFHKSQFYYFSIISFTYQKIIFKSIQMLTILNLQMSDPMQNSLQGYSQFISFENNSNLQQSLCGISQKVPIQNASLVNRQERQKDRKAFEKIKEQERIAQQIEGQDMDESANQFLNVGKWDKPKSQVKTPQNTKKIVEQKQQKLKKNQSRVSQKNTSKASKWNKSKKIQEKNKSSLQNNSGEFHIHKSTKPLTKPEEPKWHPHNSFHKQQRQDQPQQQQEESQEQQQQQQSSEEEQSEEESESEESDEEQEDEDEDDQEGQQIEEENQQQEEQEEQEEEEQQNRFTAGIDDKSSQAFQTQIANTSALDRTPKASKWAKKKPLQTLTKYEVTNNKQDTAKLHQKLNSATYAQDNEQQILEDYGEHCGDQNQEWVKVEKVLLRLKLLLS